MELVVSQLQGSGFVEVTAKHGGEQLIFSVPTYGKVKLADPERVFDEINGYWAWLPQSTCDAIWKCYQEIKVYLDTAMDSFHIERYIRKQLILMYQHTPMDTFSQWLLTKGNLHIPDEIKDTLPPDIRYTRIEQTYLKEDYINLASLSLAIRPLLPIWGEYIDQGGQGHGSDMHKEMEAIALISDTELITWPLAKDKLSTFDKLLNYITISVENAPSSLASIWKGVSTSELPMTFMAKVMVRRLTIVPLCDHTVTHPIISNIYQYVDSLLKPSLRSTADRVVAKKTDYDGRDEDDKTSRLEGYKVKQRITTGDVTHYTVATENMLGIALEVDPSFDPRLLELTTAKLDKMEHIRIHPHQILLAQWVLHRGFTPRAINHIPKVAVNRLLATAQALIWHWGFPDIAVLLQVEQVTTNNQNVPGITHQSRSSTRISRRYIADLTRLYPHSKPQRVRPNDNNVVNARTGNIAADGINNITKLIMGNTWRYHGPKELHKAAEQSEGHRLLAVQTNIKNRITELVIHLAEPTQSSASEV